MIKILVVDDEILLLKMIERLLSKYNYEVLTATSVKNALQILETGPEINIMFINISMPEESGLKLLKIVKQKYKDIVAIMMTGYTSIEEAIEAMKLGADNYLLKPFGKDILLNTIENALNILENKKYIKLQEILLDVIPLLNDYLIGKLDEENFLLQLLEITLKTQNSKKGIIFWYNEMNNSLEVFVDKGFNLPKNQKFVMDNETLSHLLNLKYPTIHPREVKTSFCKALVPQEENESLLVLPLILKEKLYAVIDIIIPRLKVEQLPETDKKILTSLSNIIVFALSNFISTKKLVEYNKLKSEFVSHISHDLRTPLMSISGAMEMLLNTEKNENKLKMLDVISRNVTRMNELIQNLLDFTRIEVDEFKLKKDTVNISEVLNNIVENFSYLASTKKIQLERDIQKDIISVVDEERLKQIVSNLISNALKFTPENGKITISCFSQDSLLETAKDSIGTIVISVLDTGIGIQPEEQQKIFEKFYKSTSEQATKLNPTGFGIGLTIVKTLVEKHDGKIEVISKPNEGTTFKIFLPMYKDTTNNKIEK